MIAFMHVQRPLTEREHEVLKLLAEGASFKEVKVSLGISYRTVKQHIQNAKTKAGVTGPVHRVIAWYVRRES